MIQCVANGLDAMHPYNDDNGNGTDVINRVSAIGQIAHKYWLEIPNHFPFVELGNFVIMPNHVHGIIIINKKIDNERNMVNGCDGDDVDGRDAINRVSTVTTYDNKTETKHGGITGNKNPMLNNNLSRIIRWYKGRVTFESRQIHADFAWQSNYNDHIIRNDESFHRINRYIHSNPKNWEKDKFYG